MGLDDRAAYGEPNPHALGFGCHEWLKNCLWIFGQAMTGIFDGHLQFRICCDPRRHDDFSWCHSLCRFECISHEIEYDLLDLDAVYKHRPLVRGEFEMGSQIRISRADKCERNRVFKQLGRAH